MKIKNTLKILIGNKKPVKIENSLKIHVENIKPSEKREHTKILVENIKPSENRKHTENRKPCPLVVSKVNLVKLTPSNMFVSSKLAAFVAFVELNFIISGGQSERFFFLWQSSRSSHGNVESIGMSSGCFALFL